VGPGASALGGWRRLAEGGYGAGMSSPPRPAWVDFHLDLMRPYAYQTSLWIREVREQSGLEINWRFFSLEEINRAEGSIRGSASGPMAGR
jgi:hypothetical protein